MHMFDLFDLPHAAPFTATKRCVAGVRVFCTLSLTKIACRCTTAVAAAEFDASITNGNTSSVLAGFRTDLGKL